MTYGGDIVLLLRNIAVASTGEPSDLATSCFRQVNSLYHLYCYAISKKIVCCTCEREVNGTKVPCLEFRNMFGRHI